MLPFTSPSRRTIGALGAIIALCGSLAAAHALAPRGKAAAAAEITAIEYAMTTAQDAPAVTKTWADDFLWYEIGPIEIHGGRPSKDLLAAQFKALGQIRTKMLRLKVHATGNRDGDMSYAVSTQNYNSDIKGGGVLDFVFRETDVFEKRNGKWWIVHQHISIPVDLASGKAIIGSEDPLKNPHSVPASAK